MEDRFNAPNIIGLDVDRRKPEMAEEHIGQIWIWFDLCYDLCIYHALTNLVAAKWWLFQQNEKYIDPA